MQTSDKSEPGVKPCLSPQCTLYFDTQHQRWVIRAPNQVVFPDSDSLEVLLLCDGTHTIEQISGQVRENQPVSENRLNDSARDIIKRFIRRGVLEAPSI